MRILDAALEALREDGYAGASSRAIARRGGFNQALIFYYFGSLDALLLAALDRTSGERLARYRAAVAEAETIEELAAAAARIYREDRDSGHMTVVSQMIAGSLAQPELAPAMIERMQPWIAFCEEALGRVLEGSPLAELVSLPEAAYALVTFYLGVNLLTHLDEDRSRTDALFERTEQLAPLFAALLGRKSAG